MTNAQANTLLEVSWEVCNKVGGIYSVITSKSTYMQDAYDDYFAIGPYKAEKARDEFKEGTAPAGWQPVLDTLENEGIKVHCGTWDVKDKPDCILIEYDEAWNNLDMLKKELWEHYGVDTLRSGDDLHEPLIFSYAVARLVQELEAHNLVDDKTVLHAHEWLAGFTVLLTKQWDCQTKTAFTTHATMLGRTISGVEGGLYEKLDSVDPDAKARELKVEDKFTTERATAHTADVFTTVSEITARECEKLLGKEPDVLVLNGLDVDHFPSFETTSVKHRKNRAEIREFLRYAFFPHYTFDTKHNLTYLFAGRYEYENKGLDILLESLKDLNEYLKSQNTKRTVSAFLCVAMPNNGPKYSILKQKNMYQHLQDQLYNHSDALLDQVLYDLLSGTNKTEAELMSASQFKDIHKTMSRFKQNTEPPLCSHELAEGEDNNRIIQRMKELGLTNSEDDPVKVILYPAYLDGNDSLINLSYFDMISGSHLGVFPSYYEPWGYTPVETAGMSVPAVTTDLAGFGKYIQKELDSLTKEKGGIYVVERDGKSYDETVQGLSQCLKHYADLRHPERVKQKMKAKMLSEIPDWSTFKDYYIQAHNHALSQ